MPQRQKSGYLLAALTALFVVAFPAENSAQEISSALRDDVLKSFAESTKEIEIDGVRIRGHEIGNGKFKPCEGKPIDINHHTLRKSDRCPQPSGTHKVEVFSGKIVSLDAETSTLEIKDDAGTVAKIFIPRSVRLVAGGKIEESSMMSFDRVGKGQRVTLYLVIPGRAEALAVGH